MIVTIVEVKPADKFGKYLHTTDGKNQLGNILTFKYKEALTVGRKCYLELDEYKQIKYYKFVGYVDDAFIAPASPPKPIVSVDRDANIAFQVAIKEIGELIRLQVMYPKGTESLLPPEIREAYFKWLKDTVVK